MERKKKNTQQVHRTAEYFGLSLCRSLYTHWHFLIFLNGLCLWLRVVLFSQGEDPLISAMAASAWFTLTWALDEPTLFCPLILSVNHYILSCHGGWQEVSVFNWTDTLTSATQARYQSHYLARFSQPGTGFATSRHSVMHWHGCGVCVCQNCRLHHWRGTPDLRAVVHRRCQRPPKGLGTELWWW